MGDPLGSSVRVSFQKQNREGVAEAQRKQYRATAESSPGCGGGPGRDVTGILMREQRAIIPQPSQKSPK